MDKILIMTTHIDTYLTEGCGRCSLGGTPQCKVHLWPKELAALRQIVLATDLVEEVKWGVPCYTYKKKNILIISAFREYCGLSFFKGTLLEDAEKILQMPGENSQSGRLIKFTSVNEIIKVEETLRSYIYEAIEIERAGLKVAFKKKPEPIPDELLNAFKQSLAFKEAFEALTPGRQRGYILFISQPKQSKTREARIEKYREKILNGLGMMDRE